jgi:SET domain-containing protein
MMLIQTAIRNSAIEGVGLFATSFIPAGAIIWKLDERFDLVYPEATVASFPPDMQDYFTRYGYPHMERHGFIVLELDNGRFMNHSEAPNTNFTRPDVGWTIADIHEGEEVTCNYYEFDRSFRGFAPSVAAQQVTNGSTAYHAG